MAHSNAFAPDHLSKSLVSAGEASELFRSVLMMKKLKMGSLGPVNDIVGLSDCVVEIIMFCPLYSSSIKPFGKV